MAPIADYRRWDQFNKLYLEYMLINILFRISLPSVGPVQQMLLIVHVKKTNKQTKQKKNQLILDLSLSLSLFSLSSQDLAFRSLAMVWVSRFFVCVWERRTPMSYCTTGWIQTTTNHTAGSLVS